MSDDEKYGHLAITKDFIKRIEELEKKLDNFIDVRCTRSSDNFHINNHNERLNKHHTEIASLRENYKRMAILNIQRDRERNINTKVLRELFDAHDGEFEEKWTNEMRAKLDGFTHKSVDGGETWEKTEKKESYKDLPKISNDGTYHIVNIGEDSGGENSDIEDECSMEGDALRKSADLKPLESCKSCDNPKDCAVCDDYKPPEPKCKHRFEIREEFEICVYCGYISNKRIEPREDDIPTIDWKYVNLLKELEQKIISEFVEDLTKEIRSYKRDLFKLRKKWKEKLK